MKQIRLTSPPAVPAGIKDGQALAYVRQLNDWATRMKSEIENASRQNDTPLQQSFVVGSFSTNTMLSGTSTGTDLANFLCSLVKAMIDKGQITITTSTGG